MKSKFLHVLAAAAFALAASVATAQVGDAPQQVSVPEVSVQSVSPSVHDFSAHVVSDSTEFDIGKAIALALGAAMMMGTVSLNGRLDEQVVQLQAAADLLLTTTVGDTLYVSMKNFRKLQIIIDIANGTTVTGSTITLKQATARAGTSEKALAFTRMLANIDVAAAATMVETAVVANTFVTDTTNSKNLRYIIDVDADSLDVAGGFDCVRLDGTGHAATASRGVCVTYVLYGARYVGANPLVD
jgi:hypothetical protein